MLNEGNLRQFLEEARTALNRPQSQALKARTDARDNIDAGDLKIIVALPKTLCSRRCASRF